MPNRLDERDGEPWCRKCYTDKFGLKGGMGVMSVSFRQLVMSFFSAPGEKPACARETDSRPDLLESYSDQTCSSARAQKRLAMPRAKKRH